MLRKSLQSILMLIGLCCLAGAGVAVVASEELVDQALFGDEQCLVAGADKRMLVPCVSMIDGQYQLGLEYFVNPFNPEVLIWKMLRRTPTRMVSDACIDLDDERGMYLPCVSFMGTRHAFALEPYLNPVDPTGRYWFMNRESLSDNWDPCIETSQEIKIVNKTKGELTFGNYGTPYCERAVNYPSWIKVNESDIVSVSSSSTYGCAFVATDIYTDIKFDGQSIAHLHINKAWGCFGTWSLGSEITNEQYSLRVEKGGTFGYDWEVTVKSH